MKREAVRRASLWKEWLDSLRCELYAVVDEVPAKDFNEGETTWVDHFRKSSVTAGVANSLTEGKMRGREPV